MRKSCALVFVFVLALPRAFATEAAPLVGLGHVPIAVKDLDGATTDYRALGFSLKPGRLHDDSVLNAHAKYPDGTELELITASRPVDELARKYLDLIAHADGPAFVALEATDFAAVETARRPMLRHISRVRTQPRISSRSASQTSRTRGS